jgi:hypothetical protein
VLKQALTTLIAKVIELHHWRASVREKLVESNERLLVFLSFFSHTSFFFFCFLIFFSFFLFYFMAADAQKWAFRPTERSTL